MELDFSKLEDIAYRGFNGAEARAKKDELIEQGYTIVEDVEMPFNSPQSITPNSSTASPKSPLKRKLEPFTGIDSSRNYRAMYRAACDFHERHNPPKVERDYWKTHIAGADETPQSELDYWESVCNDVTETASSFQHDPFLTGLLLSVYEELEREYKARREVAAKEKALDG